MSKYIDAEKLIAEIERRMSENCELGKKAECFSHRAVEDYDILALIDSLQQEQPEVDLEKLVNEEFASHCRTTEHGLVATYNRAELYRLIKRMALVFNARKEE